LDPHLAARPNRIIFLPPSSHEHNTHLVTLHTLRCLTSFFCLFKSCIFLKRPQNWLTFVPLAIEPFLVRNKPTVSQSDMFDYFAFFLIGNYTGSVDPPAWSSPPFLTPPHPILAVGVSASRHWSRFDAFPPHLLASSPSFVFSVLDISRRFPLPLVAPDEAWYFRPFVMFSRPVFSARPVMEPKRSRSLSFCI